MATFQSEYETSTNAIDSIVTTQLSSVLNWLNVPGSLIKASSSAAGFVWGYNAGSTVYICSLPCTGNWSPVDLSANGVSSVVDLTTDDSNVYILFKNSAGALSLLVTAATNQGTKSVIPVPFPAISIFSTHTYIWAQDSSNNKQKCTKPCNMPNWMSASDITVKITSTDDATLYGVDATGQAMQTNETLQSEWQPIGDVVGSIYGKGSDGTLYGIDSTQSAFSYNGTVSPLYTDGLDPTNIIVDNRSDNLWMTTQTPGDSGNVFTRSQKPDYSTIMNSVTPLDKRRDKVVDEVETNFKRQTDVMTVNKQVSDIVKYFKQMFNIDGKTAKKGKDQSGNLTEEIKRSQAQLDYVNSVIPTFLYVIALLVTVSLVYILGSHLLGNYIHVVTLGILGVGIAFIMNFSTTIK
jgi:hypothetical protein